MEIKELLQKVVSVVSKERGLRLVTRYGVSFGIIVAATLWVCFLIATEADTINPKAIAAISFSLAFGLFWATTQQMSEYRMRKDENGQLLPLPILIQVLGQVVIIIEASYLSSMGEKLETAAWLGHASFIVAFMVGASLLPFWKHKNDQQIVRWNVDFSLIGIACYFTLGISMALIGSLIAGIVDLFMIDFPMKLTVMTYSTLTILGGGSLLLLLLPDAGKANRVSPIGERFADKLGNYVLLPATCLYLLVLYAYIVKIIIAGELPNGGVSWMTTAMMAITFGTLFLRYKSLYTEEDTRFVKAVRLGLPLATLPCLTLMTVGFVRRISDYGWTPMRGYLCAVIVWFFFAVGLLLWADWQKRKGQTPRIISLLVISLVLLFVATSIVPKANIYTICTAVQREEVPTSDTPKTWSETHKTFYILDHDNASIQIPEGYTSFKNVSECDYRKSEPKRDEQGRLILEFQDRHEWYIVHFDETQEGNTVELYTDKGQLIIADGLTIIDNEGKLYINYLNGYLFEK